MDSYIIQESDVHKGEYASVSTTCKCCGHKEISYPFQPLGRVQRQDVGKMLKKVNGIWYVENDQQFKKRLMQA